MGLSWSVPIACYHRVTQFGGANDLPAGVSAPDWNVPPQVFRTQLRGLLHCGWTPVSLDTLIRAGRGGEELPAKSFAVTFDDGYRNNWTEAVPILIELDIPATIFLATKFIGGQSPFPSDTWSGAGDPRVPVESWQPLTWEDCRSALETGLVSFGCHTDSHADFRGRSHDEFRLDIEASHNRLREELGATEIPFAFPFGMKHLGFVTEELAHIVAACGFTCALTLEPNQATPEQSPFDWGRVVVEPHDTTRTLDLKFSPHYSELKQCVLAATSFLRPSVRSINS